VLLGRADAPATFGVVAGPFPFAFLLDSVTLISGPTIPARFGVQVFASRDNDLTDLTALTGEPVWTWTGENLGGEPLIPHIDYRLPLTIYPGKIVGEPGRFLKARFSVSVLGNDYFALCNLIPL